MNEHVRFTTATELRDPDLPMTTNAAEGLMRRRWTVAEIEAMVEADIISADERFELIEGEVVPMSPSGNRHELLKSALNDYWVRRRPEGLRLVPETTFRLSKDTFILPDFVFYRVSDGLVNLRPETALLAVELADTTLRRDLGRKAALYAKFGIRELWVMNAIKLETHVHRHPGPRGYGEKLIVPPKGVLKPEFAPELAVKLGSLELV